MHRFKLLSGCAFLMMFSTASSQANAQDWGGVVGGLAGGMIAGAIIANQQPRYVYVPVRQHYYTPRHRTVYAAPRRQYTHTVTTAAQTPGPSADDLRGILGSHN
jgi:adenine/guanine phosphoribosyltransferase-like PRPP-binding protein